MLRHETRLYAKEEAKATMRLISSKKLLSGVLSNGYIIGLVQTYRENDACTESDSLEVEVLMIFLVTTGPLATQAKLCSSEISLQHMRGG